MKVGDLVTVLDTDGYTFGHGILLEEDADLNRLMTYRYSKIWVFEFANAPLLKERIMNLRTDFIRPIKSAEDW